MTYGPMLSGLRKHAGAVYAYQLNSAPNRPPVWSLWPCSSKRSAADFRWSEGEQCGERPMVRTALSCSGPAPLRPVDGNSHWLHIT
jgi:hypothetical protein